MARRIEGRGTGMKEEYGDEEEEDAEEVEAGGIFGKTSLASAAMRGSFFEIGADVGG